MKQTLTIVFFFLFTKAIACSCITLPYAMQYQRADFIAVAKIISIDSLEQKMFYYTSVGIDIITLYKGDMVTKLKMANPLKDGCGVNAPLHSVWLIYANKTSDGSLTFDYCSSPIRLDRFGVNIYDDTYRIWHQQFLKRTFQVLNFLKEANLNLNVETNAHVQLVYESIKSLKGFEEPAYNFSAFELKFDKELELEEIRVLKEFNNTTLAEQLKEQLLQATIKYNGNPPLEKRERRFLVLFFFYPPEEQYQSFVSRYFL